MQSARECQRFHVGKLAGPLLIILLALASSVFAAPPLTITSSGYYLTEIDSAGEPRLVRIEQVVDLRGGSDPTPDDPPELGPPPEGISADVAEWAMEIRDSDGAQLYALIFEATRDGVKSGDLTPKQVFAVLRGSANELIDDEWSGFREKLSEYFTARVQEGAFSERVETANKLELIRYGLVYSAKDAEPLSMGEATEAIAVVNDLIEAE